MDLKHLEKLSKLCKKHGITHLTTPELSLQFDHSATESAISNTPATDIAPTIISSQSAQDALFWSSDASLIDG